MELLMKDGRTRLSGIDTHWSIVHRAHDGHDSNARDAQALLMQQYGDAVRRYLIGALGSVDAADEVFQEFAVRFVRGDFKNADPERGRFRSFVKTAVYRLIVDHYRQQKKVGRNTELAEMIAADTDGGPAQIDLEFDRSWRDELLAKAWEALESFSESNNKSDFTVLRLSADQQSLTGSELAKQLSQQLGRSISEENARQMLHRARVLFAEYLLRAVEQSIDDPTTERLEDELIALNLHDYCRVALAKRRPSP